MTLAQQIRELMGVVNDPRTMDFTIRFTAENDLRWLLMCNAETLAQAVEATEAAKVLATEAVLLLNHAEGCARDHYGHDMSLYGMPGWLADSREHIMAARKMLPTPSTKEDQNDEAG